MICDRNQKILFVVFGVFIALQIASSRVRIAQAQDQQEKKPTINEIIQDHMAQRRAARPPAGSGPSERVTFGILPGEGVFRETVAIVREKKNGAKEPFCSGVLMDQFAVLTAAHCVCVANRLDSSMESIRIAFGVSAQDSKHVIPIDRAVFFDRIEEPSFCDRFDRDEIGTIRGRDLALFFMKKFRSQVESTSEKTKEMDWQDTWANEKYFLFTERGSGPKKILKKKVFFISGGYGPNGGEFVHSGKLDEEKYFVVAPARIASPKLYYSPLIKQLLAVGYGRSVIRAGQLNGDPSKIGTKLFAPLTIRDKNCGSQAVSRRFGCSPGREAVLIDPVRDTCAGDSGGPVFIKFGEKYFLVGITSRGVSDRRCDSGGIYSLITPAAIAWMRRNGVFLHSLSFVLQ